MKNMSARLRQGSGGGERDLPQPVVDEIKRIASRHHGLLRPEHLIERAIVKDSPLHEYFTWNNGEAAEKYRLLEARSLIAQVMVVMVPGPSQEPMKVRAFVSLPTDRLAGGGFRQTEDVLKDPPKREELLKTALAELRTIERKYRHLEELCEVFSALDKIAG